MAERNIVRINLKIDKDLKKEFQIKAVRNGETMTNVLLKAIREYVEQ